jgi:D-alanine-D-alanine ligase
MKINKHIEIVCSTEARLSSMSLRSRNAVLATLTRHYTEVGITIVNTYADLQNLVDRRPDLVFLGMNFVPMNPTLGLHGSDRIWISDYLDAHNITYTGSNQMAHALEVNKPVAKLRLQSAGLRTSPFYVAEQGQPFTSNDISLNYPVFIKPTNRGGGVGIDNDSVATTFAALQSKVQSITNNLQSDSLIEEYLPGREFSVAILKNGYNEDYSVMPIELITDENENGARILAGNVKSLNTSQVLEIEDQILKSSIATLALEAFHALGARDYGRIDIRLDENGTPHFLEANLLPSLIDNYGSFPIACMLNKGLAYEPMILYIADLALTRTEALNDDSSRIATSATAAYFH